LDFQLFGKIENYQMFFNIRFQFNLIILEKGNRRVANQRSLLSMRFGLKQIIAAKIGFFSQNPDDFWIKKLV